MLAMCAIASLSYNYYPKGRGIYLSVHDVAALVVDRNPCGCERPWKCPAGGVQTPPEAVHLTPKTMGINLINCDAVYREGAGAI